MAIFRQIPWTEQPQEQGLQLADRWAGRVTFAEIGGSAFDIAKNGFDFRTFAFSTVPTAVGLAVDPTTTAGNYIEAPHTGTTEFALVSLFVPTSVTGNLQIAARDDSGTGVRIFQFRTNGAAVEFIRFNTTPSAFTASISNAAAIGSPVAAVAVSRNGGSAVEVWANGRTASATLTGTASTWSDVGRWFERLAGGVGNEHSRHYSALRAIIKGSVSSAEALELSLNPWQLFAPRVQRIWAPVGGGGGVTGSSSGSLDLAGSAAGAVALAGASSGTIALAGTAAGAAAIAAASTANLAITGTAAGAVVAAAASTASLTLTGTAAGAVAVAGASAGTLVLTGSATGTTTGAATGASAAQINLAGLAAGSVRVSGASAGTLALSGSAAGTTGAAPVLGQSAGTLHLAGSAAAQIIVRGTSAGTFALVAMPALRITPDARTLRVAADDRALLIRVEDRTLRITPP